jgi:hypothetical protein
MKKRESETRYKGRQGSRITDTLQPILCPLISLPGKKRPVSPSVEEQPSGEKKTKSEGYFFFPRMKSLATGSALQGSLKITILQSQDGAHGERERNSHHKLDSLGITLFAHPNIA